MIGGYLNNIEPAVHTFKVLSSSVVDSNRWKYIVQPVTVQLLDTDAPAVGSTAISAYHEAWNVYEVANTSTVAMGITVANLPGTFELKAIPDDTIVPGFYTQGEGRMAVLLFWPNQFDGACE